MSSTPVSIHPYFKTHPGKLEAAKALLARFIEKTSTEAGVLYYEFTICGEVIFCREAYLDGDAALAHIGNVGDVLAEMLSLSELIRIELHGPKEELEKLRAPLQSLNVEWYCSECALQR